MSPRPHKFRFYLDENFPIPAGKFLKSRGHTVIESLKVAKKAGLPDYKHLNLSIKYNSILISLDRDFRINRDLMRKVKDSPGVILINTTDSKLANLERILNKVYKKLTPDKIKGKICIASVDKIKFIK